MAKLILFNKPFKVLSQFSESGDKLTLKHFLSHAECKDCYPAGRLDYDSEGLLLLTDNGQLQHQISHPQKKLPKHYWVQVEGVPDRTAIVLLSKGVQLKDGITKPARVSAIPEPKIWERTEPVRKRSSIPTSWLEIVIKEGKNRQVRRMCAAAGYPCLRLVRYKIGAWTIDNLQPGDYKVENIHLPKQKKLY